MPKTAWDMGWSPHRLGQNLMATGNFGQQRTVVQAFAFHIGNPIYGHRVIEKTGDIVGVKPKFARVDSQRGRKGIGEQMGDPVGNGAGSVALGESLLESLRVLGFQDLVSVG
jgi:hypothetical protein